MANGWNTLDAKELWLEQNTTYNVPQKRISESTDLTEIAPAIGSTNNFKRSYILTGQQTKGITHASIHINWENLWNYDNNHTITENNILVSLISEIPNDNLERTINLIMSARNTNKEEEKRITPFISSTSQQLSNTQTYITQPLHVLNWNNLTSGLTITSANFTELRRIGINYILFGFGIAIAKTEADQGTGDTTISLQMQMREQISTDIYNPKA